MPYESQPPGALDDEPELKDEDGLSQAKSKKAGAATQNREKMKGKSNGRAAKTQLAKKDSSVSNITKSQKRATGAQKARNEIIVGVDVGTTFSGIAYGTSRSFDTQHVNVITEWPSGASTNDVLEKVPSCIALASENESLTQNKWGYEVDAELCQHAWFKLLLDKHVRRTEYDDGFLQGQGSEIVLKLPKAMAAEELMAKFLECLYIHMIGKLEQILTEEGLKATPIQFWFTSPATWSDEANALTRMAATTAGFGKRSGDSIFMIPEPEAAATAILASKVEEQPELYKPGQSVLVVDMGGGTTDLSLLTLIKAEPLRMSEAVPGIMGKYGSTSIDRAFLKLLREELGTPFENLSQTKVGPGSRFMNEFELAKKGFDGSDMQKKFRLRLIPLGHPLKLVNPQSTRYDFEEGDVIISSTELANMFDEVINNAKNLVNQQIASQKKEGGVGPRFIVLCGGLATSKYVWKKFKEYCSKTHFGKILLQTDNRAWSAVVRGAVIRGLEGSVVLAKYSRRWYGIEIHQKFTESVDNEKESFICPLKGKRAPKYFESHVKKGERFKENLLKKIKVYVGVDEDDDEPVFYWRLFSSSQDTMPRRVDDEGVEQVGVIKVDLSGVFPMTRKKLKTGAASSSTLQVEVSLNLRLGSAKGTLEIQAMHDRKKVGIATIEYGSSHQRRAAQSGGRI